MTAWLPWPAPLAPAGNPVRVMIARSFGEQCPWTARCDESARPALSTCMTTAPHRRGHDMRARDISAGAPCWMDLSTSDTTAVRAFYTGLFGWTAEEPQEEFGGYFMFNGAGGQPVAGCMPAMEGAAHDVW